MEESNFIQLIILIILSLNLQLMNDYLTPRRRHSSLFQRMEDEISKISRKLSAAKQHKENHQPTSARKFNQYEDSSLFKRYVSPRKEETAQETVRRSKPIDNSSREMTKKVGFARERSDQSDSQSRAPIRKRKFGSSYNMNQMNIEDNLYESFNQSGEVSKLLSENKLLQQQLKVMSSICEQQSFKIGYLRAESREHDQQLEQAKSLLRKEQMYMNKLVEGYRLKVNKYKSILNHEESLELSVNDL